MEERLTRQLDEVLAHADSGVLITSDWLHIHYPENARELAELLEVAGMLRPPETHVGTTLGPCRLLGELGRGGMGTVYLAELVERYRNLPVRTRVAVKVIHGHLASQTKIQQRFMTEQSVGARVRHPNVVVTHGSLRLPDRAGASLLLLMEPIEGTPLSEYRPVGPRTPESLCRLVARHAADALSAIHGLGIVHRDVKPHNFIISTDHRVVLMDLGVAQIATSSDDDSFLGSPLYAAPEQLDPDTAVDARADLFALGLTLIELALGERPETGPPYELPEPYSPFFREVVRTLTAPDPRDRFSSSRALLEILQAGEHAPWWRRHARFGDRLVGADVATSSLHGREPELAALDAALAQVAKGSGTLHLIAGEAGIGKSRLVQEFLLRNPDTLATKGGYDPDEVSFSRSGAPPAILQVFGIDQQLEGLPETLASHVRSWLRGERTAGSAVQAVDLGRALGERLAARTRPLVLWIDDLQFAPTEHLSVLRGVAESIPSGPVLLLASGRPGSWSKTFEQEPHVLAPLSVDALTDLVRDACHPRRLADDLLDKIARYAEGSPLVALSAFWGLDAQGSLRHRSDDTWGVEGFAHFDVPRDLEDTLHRRFAALEPPMKELLEAGAVAGASFALEDVAAALRVPALQVFSGLEALCGVAGILRASGGQYRFVHHCIQEVLYREIPQHARVDRHRALAERPTQSGAQSERVVAVCHHAIRGAAFELARETLMPAAQYLQETRQIDRAAVLLREACDVPGLLSSSLRLECLEERETVLRSMHAPVAEHRAVMHEWRELAREVGDHRSEVRALNVIASATTHWNEVATAEEAVEAGLRILDRKDDKALRATLLHMKSIIRWRSDHGESVQPLQEAEKLLPACPPRVQLLVRTSLLHYAMQGGDPEVLEKARAVVRLANEQSDLRARTASYGHLGEILRYQGALREALDCYAVAEAMAREVGNRQPLRFLFARRGETLHLIGRLAEAEEQLRAALSVAMDARDDHEACIQFHWLADVLADCGDVASARQCLDQAQELGTKIEHARFVATTEVSLAQLEALLGQFEVADAILRRAHAARHSLPVPLLWIYPRCIEHAAMQGAVAQAMAWVNGWHEIPSTQERRFERRIGPELWEAALGRRSPEGIPDRAEEIVDPSCALMLVRVRYLLWCIRSDPTELDGARALLDGMVRNAPERYRDTMVDNVPLYAAIRDGRRVDKAR